MKATCILFLAALCGCGYDSFDARRPEGASGAFNADIATLRASFASPYTVDRDVVVCGTVTTSDSAGNFYRVFMVEDGAGAIEIRAGLYDLHALYPEGLQVTVALRGLTLGMQAGILQAGFKALPSSYYPVEYIGHPALLEKYVSRVCVASPPVPSPTPIASLGREMCGRLVRIPSLRSCSAEGASWASPSAGAGYPPSDGYRKFKDPAGDSILVVTDGYASFAGESVPSFVTALTGILSFGPAPGTGGKDMYAVKMRGPADAEIP